MTRLLTPFAAAFVLGAALLLVACNDIGAPAPTPTPEPNDEAVVRAVDIRFEPATLTVSTGQAVTWVNEDAVGHTVTHGDQGVPVDDPLFDEPLGIGEEFSFTFDEPGEYAVTCTIHPQQNMTITVE
jgi:plastocyanin